MNSKSDTPPLYDRLGGVYAIATVVDDFIVSNLTGALKDVRMRQALLMALDREGMVKTAEKGFAKVTNSLVTRNNWLGVPSDQLDKIYADLPQYPYDVVKAKALAKEAGANGQKVVIATSPVGDNVTIATTALAAATLRLSTPACIGIAARCVVLAIASSVSPE